MNPLCVKEGIGLIPWSPLARGVLAGNKKAQTTRARTDDFTRKLYDKAEQADGQVLDRLDELSRARGISPARLALAWLLHQPAMVAPIVGASKPQHLDDAIAAIDVKLSPDEIARLNEPYVPHAIAGHS